MNVVFNCSSITDFPLPNNHYKVVTVQYTYCDPHMQVTWLLPNIIQGRLLCLAAVCWTTDHYHSCQNLGVGISEGCFIFDSASLHLEVARPIQPHRVHKSGRKTSITITQILYKLRRLSNSKNIFVKTMKIHFLSSSTKLWGQLFIFLEL